MIKNEENNLRQEIENFSGVSLELNYAAQQDELGKAVSAISNEVNINGDDFGLLLVKGNIDKEAFKHVSKYVVIQELSADNLSVNNSRYFKISAAPKGIPIEFDGFYYGIENGKVVPLNISKIDKIRTGLMKEDWSAKICENATEDDLDPLAIKMAREGFKIKFQHLSKEIDTWNDLTFLTRSRLVVKGKLTSACLLLLGREEAEHFLSPISAQISWIVKDDKNMERGYQHFGMPFILQIEPILSKIRNIKYDYSTDTSFAPVETTKYEDTVLRELLLNAVAHQNYNFGGKIVILEKPDEITISNYGEIYDNNLENILFRDAPGLYFRNQHLVNMMVNLNMIDAIGSGIKKIFMAQRYKNFPMPDVEISIPNRFNIRVYGKVLNKSYTEKLIAKKELDLRTIILLDKVQKKIQVTEEEYRMLRDQKLISGRYPDISVASKFSTSVGERPQFVEKKVYSTEELKQLVIDLIGKRTEVSRQEIDDLLLDKYPEELDEKKRRTKIKNLLFTMSKKDNTINNKGSATKPIWCLLS